MHARIINGDDIGMHESSSRLGLNKESLAIFLGLFFTDIRGRTGNLNPNISFDIGVSAQINNTHAALPDLTYNLIPANGLDV